jgi:6-phosphogluconolactonase (cycloisomerase 2 family)
VLVGGASAVSDLLYMGTYSGLIASYNATDLQLVGQTGAGQAPSWLARAPAGGKLFAVDEFASGGVVRSFNVAADGSLEPINSVSNVGEAPCHLEVHPSGRYLLASNYCGGSVVVIPVSPDGELSVPTDTVLHPGNPAGCGGAHTHHAIFDPTGAFALVADLGNDLVFGYSFDASAGRLTEVSRLLYGAWFRTAPHRSPHLY